MYTNTGMVTERVNVNQAVIRTLTKSDYLGIVRSLASGRLLDSRLLEGTEYSEVLIRTLNFFEAREVCEDYQVPNANKYLMNMFNYLFNYTMSTFGSKVKINSEHPMYQELLGECRKWVFPSQRSNDLFPSQRHDGRSYWDEENDALDIDNLKSMIDVLIPVAIMRRILIGGGHKVFIDPRKTNKWKEFAETYQDLILAA